MMSALLGIKLAATSAEDTRRIPVTAIQQPLATDVIVMLQGSAAVINRMLKKCTGTKQNASHKLSIANSTGLD
jgi:hypothetical protein